MRDRPVGLLDRSRLWRAGAAAVLVAVALTAARAATDDASVRQVSGPARAATRSEPPPDAGALPALVDGPARFPETSLPAEEAGTHRTWFASGTWWAVLPDPASGVHRIWGLSGPEGPWIDTGTLVDERPFARLDVAWDGQELVVASSGARTYRGHALRVHRFGWSASDRRWVPAPDHPIAVTTAGEPLARLAVTADGTAWLVRPRGADLEVAHSAGRSARWSAWTGVDVDDDTGDVGGFDVVAQGDDLVIVTRRLAADAVVVTRRRGDTWSSAEVAMPGIRGLGPVDASAAPGGGPLAVLVATTAAPGAAGEQAAALLLAVVPGGEPPAPPPTIAVVARAVDGLTRPSLLVHGDRARVFAVAPPTQDEIVSWYERGQVAPTALVTKDASLSDPVFVPGAGRRLMSGVDGTPVARPLLPSEIGPDGGLVAVASGAEATRWSTWTEAVEPAPQPVVPADGDGVTVLVEDTFDTLPVGGPGPTSWAAEDAEPPVGEVVDDEAFATHALRLPGGAEPVSACRSIPELPATVVTVEATLRTSGPAGSADARLLTVRGAGGSVASVRLSRLGLAGWSTSAGRVTGRTVPPGAVLLVTVRLDPSARTADITVQTEDDDVLAEGRDVPWLTAAEGPVDEVCVRAAPGRGTAVVVDSLRITQR